MLANALMKCFCVALEMNFHYAYSSSAHARCDVTERVARLTTYALACSESSFYGKFAVEEDVLLLLPSKGDFRSSSSFIERIVAVCCQSETDCLRFGDFFSDRDRVRSSIYREFKLKMENNP